MLFQKANQALFLLNWKLPCTLILLYRLSTEALRRSFGMSYPSLNFVRLQNTPVTFSVSKQKSKRGQSTSKTFLTLLRQLSQVVGKICTKKNPYNSLKKEKIFEVTSILNELLPASEVSCCAFYSLKPLKGIIWEREPLFQTHRPPREEDLDFHNPHLITSVPLKSNGVTHRLIHSRI